MLSSLAKATYVGSFRNALRLTGDDNSYFGLSVGQRLVSDWRNLKTGTSPSDAQVARRVERELANLFDLGSLQIQSSGDGKYFQLIVNDERYDLDEVGSGLAHALIVVLHTAVSQPSFLLLDEPELCLHAEKQVELLTLLGTLSTEGVVFATHNIALARTMGEHLYALETTRDHGSRVSPYEAIVDRSAFLGALSLSTVPDVGCETVLCVEGPTDVPVFTRYLRLFAKEHKVLVWPLHGDSGIGKPVALQLVELKQRLNVSVAAVVDSEKGDVNATVPENREEFKKACEENGVRCHILARRCTESYFPDRAVKSALGPECAALGDYEQPSRARWATWSKGKNLKVAQEMRREDLEHSDLGEFLASL